MSSPVVSEPTTPPAGETGRLAVSLPLPLDASLKASRAAQALQAPRPLRVAFIGQAGSGKSTQAQLLRARYKGDVLSFASPLKKLTAELFEGRMADPQFARSANQEVGVLARRLAGPDIWVNKLLAKVSTTRNCFVDDCRFMSEFHALKRLDFLIIKLSASTETLRARRPSMTDEQWRHESERDSTFMGPDALCLTEGVSEQETHLGIVAILKDFHRVP